MLKEGEGIAQAINDLSNPAPLIPKPRAARSNRVGDTNFFSHFDTAPLPTRARRSGFCHGSIGNRLGCNHCNPTRSNLCRNLPELCDPLNRGFQVRRT